jgi:hypothetical protein
MFRIESVHEQAFMYNTGGRYNVMTRQHTEIWVCFLWDRTSLLPLQYNYNSRKSVTNVKNY